LSKFPWRSPTVVLICAKPIFIAAEAAYAQRQSRQYVFSKSRPKDVGCARLVTTVQRVIGAFHENLAPFDECRGQKTKNRADNNFLGKGGVHALFGAQEVPPARRNASAGIPKSEGRSSKQAKILNRKGSGRFRVQGRLFGVQRSAFDVCFSFLPKAPLLGRHDPETEQSVGQSMGRHTGGQAFRSVRYPIV
jgi:hypothetical protein